MIRCEVCGYVIEDLFSARVEWWTTTQGGFRSRDLRIVHGPDWRQGRCLTRESEAPDGWMLHDRDLRHFFNGSSKSALSRFFDLNNKATAYRFADVEQAQSAASKLFRVMEEWLHLGEGTCDV